MSITWTKDEEANRLLEQDPLALLIGLVLDQQVPMEKAFSGPLELKRRLGHLDARRIAAADPSQLDAAFRERPALHRFPGSMASRVHRLCELVANQWGGDAGRIWNEARTGEELAKRLAALPGFGPEKVKMTVAVLAKKFGVKPPGWEAQAADWLTLADVETEEQMAQLRLAKRERKAARP